MQHIFSTYLAREGGRDDRGVPYHAESTLSSAQVLKHIFSVFYLQ